MKEQSMKAVVLAAGKSTRLKPLTDDLPKVMMPVDGKPVLEYHIINLAFAGVRDVFINLHYLPEKIAKYFGDGSRWGVSIRYSYEQQILGTAGAVKKIENELKSNSFLVVYGDNFLDIDLVHFIGFAESQPGVGTIAVFHKDDIIGSGILDILPGGEVRDFIEKPRPEEVFSHWVNAGIYYFRPEIFRYIPPGVSDFGSDVFPSILRAGEVLCAYRMPGRAWAIDNINLLNELNEYIKIDMSVKNRN
jgi:NDP-sugar pyrophosphorylase family protein